MSRSYEIDLWDGYKIAFERFSEGKHIVKDMIELFKERVSIEEQYTKNLQKIVNKLSGSNDFKGTLPGAYTALKLQMDAIQKQSGNMAAQMSSNIVVILNTFKKEHTKTEEQLEKEISNLNKELEKSTSNLQKAKTKYHQTAKETEQAIITFDKGGMVPKETAKLKAKIVTLQKQTEQTDTTYKTMVKDHQVFQSKYADDMKRLLSQYQQLEEKRGAQLKDLLEKYLASEEITISALQQSVVTFKSRVESIDYIADMQAFLDEKSTGQSPPPLVEYEPYQSSVPLDGQNSMQQSNGALTSSSTSASSTSSKPLPTAVKKSESNTNLRGEDNTNNRPRLESNGSFFKTNVQNTQPSSTSSSPLNVSYNTSPQQSPPVQQQQQQESEPKPLPVPNAGKKENIQKAKALFDYEAEEENELSFKENEIITISKIDESGWWVGSCNGRFGMFPGNYVELIEEKEITTKKPLPTPTTSPTTTPMTSQPVSENSSPSSQSQHGSDRKQPTKQRRVKAIFDFVGDADDELSIREGEELSVLSEAEGWILGINSQGKEGVFPANHIEDI